MQIGDCWFDIPTRQLFGQKDGQVLCLSDDEFNVLDLLVSQKDKVVSRQALLAVLEEHANPELVLVDIIHTLKTRLGNKYAPLIETVADQGFMLHTRLKRSRSSLADSPYQAMSVVLYSLLTAAILLMVFWLYSEVDTPKNIEGYYTHEVSLQGGALLPVNIYPVPRIAGHKDREKQVDYLIQQLKQCPQVPWEQVSVSFSTDGNMLNLLLFKREDGVPEYENIKVYQNDINISFIDPAWLVKAGVCGR
ncbi:MAG: helix-turn-helix domain-containing protein [Shewanella sp.]|nr:helix-turn-helix domain-containing protein [Shewanella sp.]MCF1432011.1 helix-turn-helix domain-containing protein [Shewanella sp.]MCF1439277.1 helix-turn-helix domain-containing protein [Shewanella sp.]MCF1459635.1 helix-turn-helix domain-containing protein [Shewanella sp.]